MRRAAAPGLACAPAANGAAPAPQSEAPQAVRLLLDLQPHAGNHTPFFVARDQGDYREAGLEVELTAGTGSLDTAKIVGAGQAPLEAASESKLRSAPSSNRGIRSRLLLAPCPGSVATPAGGSGLGGRRVRVSKGLRARNWGQGTRGLNRATLTKKLVRNPRVHCSGVPETHKPLVGGSNPSSATISPTKLGKAARSPRRSRAHTGGN